MGLYGSRDRPGFQHTLAESWEVRLLATPLEIVRYVSSRGVHANGLRRNGLWMGSLQGFPALDVNEN